MKKDIFNQIATAIKPEKVREIENFELNPQYYIDSYLNGNKSHVKQELAELYKFNPLICIKILFCLPQDLICTVIESKEIEQANIDFLFIKKVVKNN